MPGSCRRRCGQRRARTLVTTDHCACYGFLPHAAVTRVAGTNHMMPLQDRDSVGRLIRIFRQPTVVGIIEMLSTRRGTSIRPAVPKRNERAGGKNLLGFVTGPSRSPVDGQPFRRRIAALAVRWCEKRAVNLELATPCAAGCSPEVGSTWLARCARHASTPCRVLATRIDRRRPDGS